MTTRPYLIILAALLCATAHAEAPFQFEAAPGKLPKTVVPVAYRIDLKPDLVALSFTGREEIDIDVAQPTATLLLNAIDLKFAKVRLSDGGTAKVTPHPDVQTATLTFAQPVPAGRHTLVIDYSGPIPEQPSGLYYDDYQSARGAERMLVTQFETADARRMFPAWDEPAFKATFQLSVTLPADLAAVSNTPIEIETSAGTDVRGAALKKVLFARTPKMSTYLVALAAGRLERIAGRAAGTDIGVWTAAGKTESGRYALAAAQSILPYYNEYFGVPYPLPKLDLIAVPGNFDAGAMENWGAITFIDNDLLYNPATSSPETREEVFFVVAHEMAHQWSGDLVTMGWWDNIWLNEGFADWMDNKATDHFNPAWHVWLRAHDDKERAMALDVRRTTHPVQQKIADESEADAAFDAISYQKGAAIIRMLEDYLGEAVFRDGMRRYMAAHAYSNSTSADLWAALEAASDKPVGTIARSFTEQPGIPLVVVENRCVDGATVTTLSQDRFTVHDPDAGRLSWQIPVKIGPAGAVETVLLGKDGATVKFPGCGVPVEAGLGDTGYYRVSYDPASLRALTAAFTRLPAADRVSLLGDQWALVQASRADVAGYLDLTRDAKDDTELVVWTRILDSFETMDALERGAPDRAALRAYVRGLLNPVLGRIGWDPKPDEPSETAILRADLIAALGRYGDAATIAEARRRFAAFETDPASLPGALRYPVTVTVGRHADKATFDRLRALGKAASGTEDRLRYYNALGSAEDPALIAELPAIAATNELPNGRVGRFLAHAAARNDHPDLVWQGTLGRLGQILPKLASDDGDGFLPSIARSSSNPDVARELLARPDSRATSGARTESAKAAEDIAINIELRTRLLPAISVWLAAAEPARP